MVTSAAAAVPSAKKAVRVKVAPGGNHTLFQSAAKRTKLPPSATEKFTVLVAGKWWLASLGLGAPGRQEAAPGRGGRGRGEVGDRVRRGETIFVPVQANLGGEGGKARGGGGGGGGRSRDG